MSFKDVFGCLRKGVAVCVTAAFGVLTVVPPGWTGSVVPGLPAPNMVMAPAGVYQPARLIGMQVDPARPFSFDFIVSKGDSGLEGEALKKESEKLIKYFLASLAVPDDEMWVNLSPQERDRMIGEGLGRTQMGYELLAQDYVLKQMTSSLMHPQSKTGKAFWGKVYEIAQARFGTVEIPVETYNRVWVVPKEAVVVERGNGAYVVKAELDVMLESDYLGMKAAGKAQGAGHEVSEMGKEVVREVLLPQLRKAVNEDVMFAPLRQAYGGMILAEWYKRRLRESVLGQVYADKKKVGGIELKDEGLKEAVYEAYMRSVREGVFNILKAEEDPAFKQTVLRRYFSGGIVGFNNSKDGFGLFKEAVLKIIGPGDENYGIVKHLLERLENDGPFVAIKTELIEHISDLEDATKTARMFIEVIKALRTNSNQIQDQMIQNATQNKRNPNDQIWPFISVREIVDIIKPSIEEFAKDPNLDLSLLPVIIQVYYRSIGMYVVDEESKTIQYVGMGGSALTPELRLKAALESMKLKLKNMMDGENTQWDEETQALAAKVLGVLDDENYRSEFVNEQEGTIDLIRLANIAAKEAGDIGEAKTLHFLVDLFENDPTVRPVLQNIESIEEMMVLEDELKLVFPFHPKVQILLYQTQQVFIKHPDLPFPLLKMWLFWRLLRYGSWPLAAERYLHDQLVQAQRQWVTWLNQTNLTQPTSRPTWRWPKEMSLAFRRWAVTGSDRLGPVMPVSEVLSTPLSSDAAVSSWMLALTNSRQLILWRFLKIGQAQLMRIDLIGSFRLKQWFDRMIPSLERIEHWLTKHKASVGLHNEDLLFQLTKKINELEESYALHGWRSFYLLQHELRYIQEYLVKVHRRVFQNLSQLDQEEQKKYLLWYKEYLLWYEAYIKSSRQLAVAAAVEAFYRYYTENNNIDDRKIWLNLAKTLVPDGFSIAETEKIIRELRLLLGQKAQQNDFKKEIETVLKRRYLKANIPSEVALAVRLLTFDLLSHEGSSVHDKASQVAQKIFDEWVGSLEGGITDNLLIKLEGASGVPLFLIESYLKKRGWIRRSKVDGWQPPLRYAGAAAAGEGHNSTDHVTISGMITIRDQRVDPNQLATIWPSEQQWDELAKTVRFVSYGEVIPGWLAVAIRVGDRWQKVVMPDEELKGLSTGPYDEEQWERAVWVSSVPIDFYIQNNRIAVQLGPVEEGGFWRLTISGVEVEGERKNTLVFQFNIGDLTWENVLKKFKKVLLPLYDMLTQEEDWSNAVRTFIERLYEEFSIHYSGSGERQTPALAGAGDKSFDGGMVVYHPLVRKLETYLQGGKRWSLASEESLFMDLRFLDGEVLSDEALTRRLNELKPMVVSRWAGEMLETFLMKNYSSDEWEKKILEISVMLGVDDESFTRIQDSLEEWRHLKLLIDKRKKHWKRNETYIQRMNQLEFTAKTTGSLVQEAFQKKVRDFISRMVNLDRLAEAEKLDSKQQQQILQDLWMIMGVAHLIKKHKDVLIMGHFVEFLDYIKDRLRRYMDRFDEKNKILIEELFLIEELLFTTHHALIQTERKQRSFFHQIWEFLFKDAGGHDLLSEQNRFQGDIRISRVMALIWVLGQNVQENPQEAEAYQHIYERALHAVVDLIIQRLQEAMNEDRGINIDDASWRLRTLSFDERYGFLTSDHIDEIAKQTGLKLDKVHAILDKSQIPFKDERWQKSGLSASSNNNPGGIDLSSLFLDLTIKRDETGMPLPVDEQPAELFHIEGLVPVILDIRPVSLPMLLGLNEDETPQDKATKASVTQEPLKPRAGVLKAVREEEAAQAG